jgi:hypothetical protein
MRDPNIEVIANSAEHSLSNTSPTPFSAKGFTRLKEGIDEYIDSLTGEAYRIALRSRADTISSAHVEEAERHLVARSTRSVFRHLGTLGGILLGAALSQLVTMLSDAKFNPTGVSLTAVFGIVGAFLVALSMAKD